MKKAGDIMKDMGFREDAPDSLKEAFVRHLVKAATGISVEPGPNEKKAQTSRHSSPDKQGPHQLEFDLTGSDGKKVS